MKLILSLILLFFVNCQSKQEITSPKKSSKPHEQSEVESQQLNPTKKDFFLKASHVEYYEIPELNEIVNPEDLGTFSIRVKNTNHIERFRILTTSDEMQFYRTPSKNCKPSFNSALVFKNQNKSETILFSRNCGLLYLYQEKLYTDVQRQSMEIENTFRMIRSGR